MSSKDDKKEAVKITHIGGQAVMEGVMMQGKTGYAVSVRNPSEGIKTVFHKKKLASKGFSLMKLPIFRGMSAFVSSLVTGMKVISESAELSGLDDLEEENPSKLDQWLEKKFGDKLFNIIISISVVIAIGLGILLFMVLPTGVSALLNRFLQVPVRGLGVIEGLMRLVIFLIYIFLISRLKDVSRLFQYHGAEHKTINCFEHGKPLTVENVREHTRFHKRCGTSFLLLVMLVSMVVFFFVTVETVWLRILTRIILVPFIAGISYELIRWAGRSDSVIVSIISAPGLWLQRLTTKEPDDSQIEVAISAMNSVLEDEAKHELS